MVAIYPEADPLSQRSLTDDDRAGICAVYPPGEIRAACDATPRHGFSPLCAAAQSEPPTPPPAPADEAEACCCPEGWACEKGVCSDPGGCALSAGRAGGGAAWPTALLLFGALAARRRRP
jgi:MYXO-CTERM domain-containing protein